MIVTPVFSSPRISAQLIGAAPPVLREEGRVDVDAAPFLSVNDLPGEDLAEGCDDNNLRCELTEMGKKRGVPHVFRLEDTQAKIFGQNIT
jgi:hypothetical protein